MRGRIQKEFPDLGGGLNLSAEPELLKPNQSPALSDVVPVLGRRGAIKRRGGSLKFGTITSNFSFAPLQGGPTANIFAPAPLYSGSPQTLLVEFTTLNPNTQLPELFTVVVDQNALTSIGRPGSNAMQWVHGAKVDGFGPYWATDWSGAVVETWTGAAGGGLSTWTARTGTLSPGRCIAWFQNRMFLGGAWPINPTDPSVVHSLRWSDVGDPRAWPGNEVKISPSDQDYITALGAVGNYLVVFKQRLAYVVYDSDTGANRRLTGAVGAPSPRVVVETPRGLCWLASDGNVYMTDGNTFRTISDAIAPALRNYTFPQLRAAVGVLYRNRVLFSVPNSTLPSGNGNTQPATYDVWDYDLLTETWWRHNMPLAALATVVDASGAEQLYGLWDGVAGAKAIVRLFDDTLPNDGASAFNAYWTSQPTFFGSASLKTRHRATHVRGSGTFDVSLMKDFATDPTAFKRTLALPAGVEGSGRVLSGGVARAWQHRFASTTPFEVDGYSAALEALRN